MRLNSAWRDTVQLQLSFSALISLHRTGSLYAIATLTGSSNHDQVGTHLRRTRAVVLFCFHSARHRCTKPSLLQPCSPAFWHHWSAWNQRCPDCRHHLPVCGGSLQDLHGPEVHNTTSRVDTTRTVVHSLVRFVNVPTLGRHAPGPGLSVNQFRIGHCFREQ